MLTVLIRRWLRVSACTKHGMEKKRLAKNTDIGAQRDVWCDTCKFIYEQPLRYIVIRRLAAP